MYDGTIESHIELTCINDPTGGSSPPYWDPPYDHVTNPFPKCVPMRKYWNCLKSKAMSILMLSELQHNLCILEQKYGKA